VEQQRLAVLFADEPSRVAGALVSQPFRATPEEEPNPEDKAQAGAPIEQQVFDMPAFPHEMGK
jgi:hypothetical protein